MWKEAADHNTHAAKLYAEKNDLFNKLEALKAEVKQSPESLTAQNRGLFELNESLNQYLKTYCEESKKEVDKELVNVKIDCQEKLQEMAIRVQELTQIDVDKQKKYADKEETYKSLINQLKSDIQRIENQFSDER